MIVVGLNGATPGVVRRGIESGCLETFQRLFREGASGQVWGFTASPPVQWSSHLTGLPPGETGVSGYLSRRRVYGGVGLARTEDLRVKTYPELLDEAGVRVGLVNLPPTYPPLELEHGFCASGMLTPAGTDDYVRPLGLREQFGEYRIGVQDDALRVTPLGEPIHSTPRPGLKLSLEELEEDVRDVENRRMETARRLLEEEDPDLMVLMVSDLDVLHRFAHHQLSEDSFEDSAMMGLYRDIDRFLSEVIERYPDRPLLVFSGHGYEPVGDVSWIDRLGRMVQSTYKDLRPEEDIFGGKADLVTDLRGAIGNAIPARVKQTVVYTKLYNLFQRFAGGALASDVDEDLPDEELEPTGIRNLKGLWALRGARARAGCHRDLRHLDLSVLLMALLDQPVPDSWVGRFPEDVVEGSVSLRREPVDLSVERGDPPSPNRDLQRKIEEELQEG